MSSAGQTIGGVIGATIGFFVGGPQGAVYGAQIGMSVGGAIDPPKGPKLQGPRLNDLSVQTSTYGAVIPRAYGTVALNGNVFWLENNALKEVATQSEQGGKGGGGGATVTTYSYLATFAVGLCRGPIAGVRRIWIGSKLIYDVSPQYAGETTSGFVQRLTASNEAAAYFTLHTGSDTQDADDRMQATLGVADTPAYRGLAYIVFKDYPLKDHGNSLMGAQVRAEVVISGSGAAAASVTLQLRMNGADGSTTFTNDGNAAPGGVTMIPLSSSVISTAQSISAGSSALFDGVNDNLVSSTTSVAWNFGSGDFTAEAWFLLTGNAALDGNPARLAGIVGFGGNSSPAWTIEVLGDDTTTGTGILFEVGVNGTGQSLAWGASEEEGPISHNEWHHVAVVRDGGWLRMYLDGRFKSQRTISGILGSSGASAATAGNLVIGKSTYGSPYNRYFPGYIDDVRITKGACRYYANFQPNAIPAVDELTYLSANLATLASVLTAEVEASALLTASDIDVTAISDDVRGYRVGTIAAIRAAIEPLQGAFPFDVIQQGYGIEFRPRGGASVATIPGHLLDARAIGEAPGVAITNVREMDHVLPRRVTLRYLDQGREYDTGEQYAERLNTEAINVREVELPLVMNGDEAAATAETLLYLYWLERYDISFRLPPDYLHLEPGDVVTIETDSASYELRLTAITYTPDGRLECQAKYNAAAVYSATALGADGVATGQVLALAGNSIYQLLDIPALRDADDRAGFPVAMGGNLAGWPGGILYRTDDEGQTWVDLQGFTAPGAAIGYTGAAIGAGRFDIIDAASALSVVLYSGSLASVTELAMLNGANHFAYGAHGRWEIIAAQNCTLQGDGSYILTNLLRGRFGTEWAAGSHLAGDAIVLLDSARLSFVGSSLDAIGLARTYRGITVGQALSIDVDRAFTYSGVNLECLSPVYLNGNRHPSTNDWTLTWIRRTRIGGAWRDLVDATLGEASESYEVDIFDGAGYSVVKRTLSASSPTVAYTSADQVTDFGSNQSTLYVKVYQLSANVGRGYPLTTSITR